VKLRALVPVVLTLALVASTAVGTSVGALTAFPVTTMPRPAIGTATSLAGWMPVAFGDAQISVPAGSTSSTLILSAVPYCDPARIGGLWLGLQLLGGTIQPNGTLVHFHPLTRNPGWWRNEKPMRLNGLSVYLGPGMDPYLAGYGLEYETNDYIVPSLDIEVAGVGPLAKQVLNTLTRSPRSVVLASASSPVVPSSWQSVRFAGLRFSVPANWPVNRTQVTPV
jgi:hypothetical protein